MIAMQPMKLLSGWQGTTFLFCKSHVRVVDNIFRKKNSSISFCQWEMLRRAAVTPLFSPTHRCLQCCQSADISSKPKLGDALLKETSPVEFDLDLGSRLLNPAELQRNFQLRKMKDGLNLQRLAREYNRLVMLASEKGDLEHEIASLSRKLKENSQTEDAREKTNLHLELSNTRQSLKLLMKRYIKLKQDVESLALVLPNLIHNDTPETEEKIILEFNPLDDHPHCNMSHVDIGRKFNLIKFSNIGEKAYYLKGEAALMEQTLINYFTTGLTELDFQPMSAPEFIKDFVVEGSGIKLADTFTLHREDDEKERSVMEMSVLGNSIAQYSAFLTKVNISSKVLPLKYFSVGRSYRPVNETSLPGLFSCTQTVKTSLCAVCSSDEECYEIAGHLWTDLWNMYKPFNIPMRLSMAPACGLHISEQLRVELQLWVPSVRQYLPVSSVSVLGDYVSRRLMIRRALNYDRYTDSHLVHMVYGEVLDATRLIAILLEYGFVDEKQGILKMPHVQCLEDHDMSQ